MSHAGKGKPEKDGDDSALESSSSDEEEDYDEDREETPDLYRNSSLGMYSGVRWFSIDMTFVLTPTFCKGNGQRAILSRRRNGRGRRGY